MIFILFNSQRKNDFKNEHQAQCSSLWFLAAHIVCLELRASQNLHSQNEAFIDVETRVIKLLFYELHIIKASHV